MTVKPVPDGFHAVTPYLVVADVPKLIAFLEAAFGARELYRSTTPDGRVMHATVQLGDSRLMMGEAMEAFPPSPAVLYHYVTDADAVYEKAIAAGARSIMPPTDQFYGDRNGGVEDPCGNKWWISTHIEDVDSAEIDRRMREREGH
jgi:uncharacterized glyoxalase superfamily protein PhnB